MAQIEITCFDGGFEANDCTFPFGGEVSFHSDTDCTVCFSEPLTFGLFSINLHGGSEVHIRVSARRPTHFFVVPLGASCLANEDKTPQGRVIPQGGGS